MDHAPICKTACIQLGTRRPIQQPIKMEDEDRDPFGQTASFVLEDGRVVVFRHALSHESFAFECAELRADVRFAFGHSSLVADLFDKYVHGTVVVLIVAHEPVDQRLLTGFAASRPEKADWIPIQTLVIDVGRIHERCLPNLKLTDAGTEVAVKNAVQSVVDDAFTRMMAIKPSAAQIKWFEFFKLPVGGRATNLNSATMEVMERDLEATPLYMRPAWSFPIGSDTHGSSTVVYRNGEFVDQTRRGPQPIVCYERYSAEELEKATFRPVTREGKQTIAEIKRAAVLRERSRRRAI